MAEDVIASFDTRFQDSWLAMMRRKLGLFGDDADDRALAEDLLTWMQQQQADYTNTFRDLSCDRLPDRDMYHRDSLQSWWQRWQDRLQRNSKPRRSSVCLMRASNPAVIPRNHKVEEVLKAAEGRSDLHALHTFLKALRIPYRDHPEYDAFHHPPQPHERVYQTFCGT